MSDNRNNGRPFHNCAIGYPNRRFMRGSGTSPNAMNNSQLTCTIVRSEAASSSAGGSANRRIAGGAIAAAVLPEWPCALPRRRAIFGDTSH